MGENIAILHSSVEFFNLETEIWEDVIKFVSPPDAEAATVISQALELSGSDVNVIFLVLSLLFVLDWGTEGQGYLARRSPAGSARKRTPKIYATSPNAEEHVEEDVLILVNPVKTNDINNPTIVRQR